nr:hypothetical protein pmam_442 [Pithovirus mammoth]
MSYVKSSISAVASEDGKLRFVSATPSRPKHCKVMTCGGADPQSRREAARERLRKKAALSSVETSDTTSSETP